MIELQCLNKCLSNRDISFLVDNGLDISFFPNYKEEYIFIKKHYDKYKSVPDVSTFLSNFNDFDLIDVSEENVYLINKLKEEKLANTLLKIINKGAEIYEKDVNASLDYFKNALGNINTTYEVKGLDFVESAIDRYNETVSRQSKPEGYYYSTGFKELDRLVTGFQRGEELAVVVGRTSSGKSWLGSKFALSVFEQGANVGIITPEMSPLNLAYRIDTLKSNISNRELTTGQNFTEERKKDYLEYINELKRYKNKMLITKPQDFDNNVTVSKIRQWVKNNELNCVFIDGLTYLRDERRRSSDNVTIALTNISEDLMTLSIEEKIPIIVVIQANREAVDKENKDAVPELHHIRGSDGISHSATKVFSMRNKKGNLEIGIKKDRNGVKDVNLIYNWSIDRGIFEYIPTNDNESLDVDLPKVSDLANKADDNLEDIF